MLHLSLRNLAVFQLPERQLLQTINSTYGADVSVLVQMSTELAQTGDKMHALLQSQTPADTM